MYMQWGDHVLYYNNKYISYKNVKCTMDIYMCVFKGFPEYEEIASSHVEMLWKMVLGSEKIISVKKKLATLYYVLYLQFIVCI